MPVAAPPTTLAVRTEGLTLRFGPHSGIEQVDLRVPTGGVYALLGPNGAGKSTTLKCLLGLLEPQSGSIEMFGQPWQRPVLARVGASIDGPALYGHLSAAQNLTIHAHLIGAPKARVVELLRTLQLDGTGRKPARKFSTGMKGRLALAIALLGNPDLLVLDEPQNGLDPEGIRALRLMLRRFADEGRTVLISSHQLGEVAHLADTVGVLVDGRLRHQGSLADLAPDGDLETAYLRLSGALA